MNKYLLEILKDNNTIIIPGLGALTITNKETREMMFMPYLKHDDGKLAGFIAEKDGVDETDAKNIVAKYIREIKAELDKGESFSMFQLGTFSKKDDGEIHFDNWTNTSVEEEPSTPVAAPLMEEAAAPEEPVIEEAPEMVTETVSEPADAKHQDKGTESDFTEHVKPAPEPAAVEPEPIIEPEPTIDPQPVVPKEPAPIEETKLETPEPISEIDDFIPEKTTLEHSALLDDIAPTSAVALDPEIESGIEDNEEENGEAEEEEEKKKAGVGFWVTLIVVALGIIAGGAYVGRNYNELKQHIPFLADKDEDDKKKSLKDEISNVIKEDKYSKPEDGSENIEESSNGEEGFSEEGQSEEIDEGSNETMEAETPEPETQTPEVKTPEPVNISSSSGGPFKVIAGAFSSVDNANRLAAEYKAKGMNSEVFLKGTLHAVSIQSYPTSEAANADLSKLKTMAPGAWIYYKR